MTQPAPGTERREPRPTGIGEQARPPQQDPPNPSPKIPPFIIPPFLALILSIAAVFLLGLPALERNMMAAKREKLRHLVDAAWGILAVLNQEVDAGELTIAQAREKAVTLFRSMRYGPENKDYFWINDLHPRMVMHPYRVDLEGKDISRFTDPRGKRLFQAFVDKVKAEGKGFVSYQWQWQDEESLIVPKLSYVRGFPPWGWILGTGVYLDDVEREVAALQRKLLLAFGGILLLMTLLSAYLVIQSTRAARRERASHERFRSVMDSIDALVYVTDLATDRILFINRYGRSIWGDAVGRICYEAMRLNQDQPCEHCAKGKLLTAQGEPAGVVQWETRNSADGEWYECRDQAIRWVDGRLVHLGIATNITARKAAEDAQDRLEKELVQAQKMEALGQLAGGVAHDFNNLLAAIMGLAELIGMREEEGTRSGKYAREIVKTCRRAAEVTQQLLTFSRKGRLSFETCNINQVIADTIGLLKHAIDPRILIDRDLQADPAEIRGDVAQLQNVLLNLGVNARDAMPDGGRLRFQTARAYLNDDDCRHGPHDIRPGVYVRIRVVDTGKGMDRAVLDRVLEPFFTTKERGKGTGLGLASAYGCIKSHEGSLLVESEPGRGTMVEILLPAQRSREQEQTTRPEEEPVSGQGRILLVDDDQGVRSFAAQALRELGYTVTECVDGAQAVEFFSSRPNEIDLVIMDLVMPRMSGQEAFVQMQRINPQVSVVLISGYAQRSIEVALLEQGVRGFLAKPFTIAELSRLVACHLGQPAPPG